MEVPNYVILPIIEIGTFYECFFCGKQGSPVRSLMHCGGCQLVSYCSKDCQKDDWRAHKPVCKEFPVVNGRNALYTTRDWVEHHADLLKRAADFHPDADKIAMPIFRYPKVCHTCFESRPDLLNVCKCAFAFYCSKTCASADKLHGLSYCNYLKDTAEAMSLETMRQSYPASFWHFLRKMEQAGPDRCRTEELITLDIHIITKTAYFDAMAWEFLVHRLPNLEQLNLVFVIHGSTYDPSFDRREYLTQLGCRKCEFEGRIITYSVHQKPYHMFFSSPEYTEPDFVVAYGIPYESNDIHSEISYRNMTYCSHSVLVLFDSSKDLLIQAVKDVKAAQPSSGVLYTPDINRSRGFGSNRSALDFDADAPNVKHYITICLNWQKKNISYKRPENKTVMETKVKGGDGFSF